MVSPRTKAEGCDNGIRLVSKTSGSNPLQVRVLYPPLSDGVCGKISEEVSEFMLFFKKEKRQPENLKDVLKRFSDLENSFEKISKELADLKEKNKLNIQKIGIVRFNPFKEVGSDQSFSLALLDANDSGAVITSLYTREENRIYGKPISNGKSEYVLSEEEKEAINKAKNGDQKPKLNSQATGSGDSGAC